MAGFLQPDHLAYQWYDELGIDLKEFKKFIEQQIDKIAIVEGSNIAYGQQISPSLNRLLADAGQLAEERGDQYLATEIVMLAIYKQKNHPITEYLLNHQLMKTNS